MNAFIEKWANTPRIIPIETTPAFPAEPQNDSSGAAKETDESVPTPDPDGEDLDQAPAVVSRACKEPDAAALSLKGQAVELWRDGRRFFLVADEEDALEAIRRFGGHRGEVWTSGELELVATIPDQATRDEVESLKREMDGCLSPGTVGKCVSAVEWQAQMLNQMFKEQGVTGQPGNITAKTVNHGERRRK